MITNLNRVKEVAVSFLLLPISETEFSPVVVQHPIFESGFYSTIVNGEFKVVSLLEDEESLKGATDKIRNKIEHADNIYDVYAVIRAPYRLVFLKHAKQYLSLADFSELLADAWVSSENPNDDVNVSVRTLASWFKHADKKALMTEEDYEVYKSLPDTITVYRGITPGIIRKGCRGHRT